MTDRWVTPDRIAQCLGEDLKLRPWPQPKLGTWKPMLTQQSKAEKQTRQEGEK